MKSIPFSPRLALLLVLLSTPLSQAEERLPRFPVIFCDYLGYGDSEPFSSKVHRIPNLNRIAAEGRKFSRFCIIAGVCTPSRVSLLTGCQAKRVGIQQNPRGYHLLRPVSPQGLHPDEVTIGMDRNGRRSP